MNENQPKLIFKTREIAGHDPHKGIVYSHAIQEIPYDYEPGKGNQGVIYSCSPHVSEKIMKALEMGMNNDDWVIFKMCFFEEVLFRFRKEWSIEEDEVDIDKMIALIFKGAGLLSSPIIRTLFLDSVYIATLECPANQHNDLAFTNIQFKAAFQKRRNEVLPTVPASSQLKILMLTANPAGTSQLNLDKEHSRIAEKIQHKKDAFDLTVKRAIDRTDFKELTEATKPHILHFSGHGDANEGGIILQNDDKNGYAMISSDVLDVLFEYFTGEGLNFKAVVLNACYSDDQAQAIAKHVPYVIGTTVAIGDELAIAFSVGFYFKLESSGLNIEQAFKSGRVEAQPVGAKKSHFVLFKNGERLDL